MSVLYRSGPGVDPTVMYLLALACDESRRALSTAAPGTPAILAPR
jgi:hypothetical protein